MPINPYYLFANGSRHLYQLLEKEQLFGTHYRFMNLGYWSGQMSYDEASVNLAMQLGHFADLKKDQVILSVGCGFGDDVHIWHNHFQLGQSIGINSFAPQLKEAQQRYQNDGIQFCQANATILPFQSNSINSILALESALHFENREDFFKEANRVLKPNGVIALADVILSHEKLNWTQKCLLKLATRVAKVPVANQHTLAAYQQKLQAAGFYSIEVKDVSKKVLKGFMLYLAHKLKDKQIKTPFALTILLFAFRRKMPVSYIMIKALKR
ncbi:MAG: class I SAM-dependent methyltransferase [Candidatus Berkiella sp.]